MVLLKSSNSSGMAYVGTENLDGETSYKEKYVNVLLKTVYETVDQVIKPFRQFIYNLLVS